MTTGKHPSLPALGIFVVVIKRLANQFEMQGEDSRGKFFSSKMFGGVIKERRSLDLIIQEICMTCIGQGLNTTEAMAKYAVSIVTLDPQVLEKLRNSSALIFHITEHAVHYLMSMKGIKARLLVAQAYYTEEFKNEDHVVEQHRRMITLFADPLTKHVIVYDRAHADAAMVLRHIVLLTIILTGMGDPTNPLIYKEAEAAVTSVMSMKDVKKFIHLSAYKKRHQLLEIIKLVTGIRIYNRARSEAPGVGEDDIDDLPRLLVTSISTMQTMVEEYLNQLTVSVTSLEYSMEECFEWDFKSANLLNYTKAFVTDEEYDFAKNILCLWQQICIILKTILKNISRNLYEQLKSEDEMRSKILLMMDKLSCKVGVPSKEVFPHFLELYTHWKGFQNRLVLVNEYNRMLKKMQEYSSVYDIPLSVQRAIDGDYWMVPDPEEAEVLLTGSNSIEVLFFKEDEPSRVLEFNGFCPVWLTLTDGILLKGNRKIGILKFGDKYYSVRDLKAGMLFKQSAETYISKVYSFGRHNPEYIDILQLRAGLKSRGGHAGGWTRHKRHFKRDKLIQSEVHPIPEFIDERYRHSTWALKKDACQLADLRHRKTHGAQTRLSHWKRSVQTQSYESKTGGSQTMKNNHTNVPTLQNFMFGLRGRRDEVQHLVTLTRPVEEGPKEIVEQEPVLDVCRNHECSRFGKCDCHCVCYGCQRTDRTRTCALNS